MKSTLFVMFSLVLALMLLPAHDATARNADGTLGTIVTPNNGVPALVLPGAAFEATLTAEAPLELVSAAGPIALQTQSTPIPGNRFHVQCTVPETAAPGAYALRANGPQPDETPRAVWVLDKVREYYVVAHVSDTHIGYDLDHPGQNDETLTAILAAINASDGHFVTITGDLTHNGDEDQFRRFLAVLDTCTLPTFVCVGNHDRTGTNYERFFGPLWYTFTFGPDGYLVFDTKDFCTANDLGEQDGALERLRRDIKPCRYSIGIAHRYEPEMGMRAQIALFVDNPLDMLLFGHWHRENTANEPAVPWGATRISVAPAGFEGAYRLLDMTARGFLPREVQHVDVKIKEAPKPEPPKAETAPEQPRKEEASKDKQQPSGSSKKKSSSKGKKK